MIQRNQKVIKMISVSNGYKQDGKFYGRFYENDLDVEHGVQGDVKDRFVIWSINEDKELEISHIQITSETKNSGLKFSIEVADNGFIASSKEKKQICTNLYHVQESHSEHALNIPVEASDIDCDDVVAKYYADEL